MTVHTGPNTAPGGCHRGLSSRRYQRLSRAGVVATAPLPAVAATAVRMHAAPRGVSRDRRCSGSGSAVATRATLHPGALVSRVADH